MPHKTYSAIFPIILRDNQQEILLHLRQNTGYCDGFWDTAGSGHVEDNETAKEAVLRECKEEIGIEIDPCHLEFAHLTHHFSKKSDLNYYHIYFVVRSYVGIPAIMEPDKCLELRWFPLSELPDHMIPCRKMAIEAWMKDIRYTEVEDKQKTDL